MKNREIIIALLSAVFGFMGAIGAPYLTSLNDQNNWEERFRINYKSELVNKRVKLIEEMIGFSVDMKQYGILIKQMELTNEAAQIALDCKYAQVDAGFDPKTCESGSDVVKTDKIFKELLDIQRSFSKTVSMCGYFFGPKSRDALLELNNSDENWWKVYEENSTAIIETLYSELYYFDDQS